LKKEYDCLGGRMTLSVIIAIIAGFSIAGALGFFVVQKISESKIKAAELESKRVTESAEKEADLIKKTASLEAKDELYKIKSKFEEDTKSKRMELQQQEKKLIQKESSLDRKLDLVNKKAEENTKKEELIDHQAKDLEKRKEEINLLIEKENKKLEQISGMNTDEAKSLLMKNLENRYRHEASVMAKQIRETAIRNANKEAKELIISTIQRCAADYTVESTVSVVALPNDEMKGRIIGREGRNIRSFENATGVDVIVDDTPEAIILSGFHPMNREIARLAMEKLITDGRIHPGRIEEVVDKATKEVETAMIEEAEKVLFDLGIHDVHPEVVKLLGKLKFRTSYGQNVLKHSKEVAILSGLMASELDLDVNVAKRAGLLHDLGKAIDQNIEGTHTEIGFQAAKKYGENEIILNAIQGHHEDVEAISPITILVQAADAISGARPGARRETLEHYVKRLETLESLADSFNGVDKAFAIQAGREIRVIVEPKEIDDLAAQDMATGIATKIKDEMEFPGQIKVTVIRETRAIDYAK